MKWKMCKLYIRKTSMIISKFFLIMKSTVIFSSSFSPKNNPFLTKWIVFLSFLGQMQRHLQGWFYSVLFPLLLEFLIIYHLKRTELILTMTRYIFTPFYSVYICDFYYLSWLQCRSTRLLFSSSPLYTYINLHHFNSNLSIRITLFQKLSIIQIKKSIYT